MATPDESWPDGTNPDEGGDAAGRGRPVPDAEWNALIEELSGPAEARGTLDSFAVPVDADLRANARDELAGLCAGQQQSGQQPGAEQRQDADDAGPADATEPATQPARMTLPGSLVVAVASSWRRGLAAVDRWLRRPPATLTLPAGSKARFTIGREPGCDMRLLDRTVSRLHASLKREDGGWLLTDLGSTNGTRLNGWRVTTPITVVAGDLVSFGAATFVLADRPAAGAGR